ncbi:glycerol-3-phosphate dehydrogenase/oxidase [Nitratireductor mangrovi]|uniref:Glycerol-3-phosphate dehydrogenase/oxidase n=1 Tax=Nitratireductor mangrovi TaxID=2599600 RepID=A0A5B8L6X9_9HYPH|nr:glycerol-3-phosphate dehydrogenase/oxidase [Nitratireductor mangrovi]QDZ03198.1 glycerol-3-phosphate dehydrogenase/oxidase [Nitratireductor mangrovi]
MPEQRDQKIEGLRRDGHFDVIVVGGGINGIGVYRELAAQGLRVLLVERNDFCSGCSAAPSRMIHGGLRYLENGEFDLVRESLCERDALLSNAPHMVRPLPTTIPVTSIFSGLLNGTASFLGLSRQPSSRGAVPIKIGLTMYDWITRSRRAFPKHTFRGRDQTLHLWPKLNPDLRCSATYYDAWISYPERMGIELVLDAEKLSPESVALNYAEVTSPNGGLSLEDLMSGEIFAVEARAIVNATGAWVDDAIERLTDNSRGSKPLVAGTKGSHLVIDNPELYHALNGHMIYFENTDGRVCIVFPYLGKVLAGATDIRVDKASRVRCEPEERDYIFQALRAVFPSVAIRSDDVVFSFSGIRPLPLSDHEFTGRISRSHFVHRLDGTIPQFCLVGGKWTTFRAFAEQTVDAVLAELEQTRKTGTLDMAIGGGAGFSDDYAGQLADRHAISADRAAYLVDLYGTRADEVVVFCADRADDTPVDNLCHTSAAEIAFLVQQELVCRLGDILLRRTPLAIRGEISDTVIDRVAAIVAAEAGWDEAKTLNEIQDFRSELEEFYGVSAEMLERRTRDRSETCA